MFKAVLERSLVAAGAKAEAEAIRRAETQATNFIFSNILLLFLEGKLVQSNDYIS